MTRAGSPKASSSASIGRKPTAARGPSAPSGRNVLEQSAKSPRPAFNLVLIDGTSYKDVDISVKLKAVSGEIDQGGGVVWRARDAKNYYIARYNPLEANFRVYKVEDARSFLQGTGLDAEVLASQVDGRFMGAFVRARKPVRS